MSAAASRALKPAVLHILLALADRDRHGYGILQAVDELSQGSVALNTASLYRHLTRVLDEGLVAEAPRRPEHDDPRRGTYYRLTAAGRRALVVERARLASLVEAVDRLSPAAPNRSR